MKQFCEDVIAYLTSEYDDGYQFSINLRTECPSYLVPMPYKVELSIKMTPIYSLTIVHESMMYIYGHYCSQEYIGERNQYRWQKELIDLIEGS